MENLINSLEFERLLESIMWSRFWGISVDEFTFSPEFDFNSIPRKHIRPKEKVIVRQQGDNEGISYAGDEMIIQWGRDDDLGLLLKSLHTSFISGEVLAIGHSLSNCSVCPSVSGNITLWTIRAAGC